jgi:hypothetical protein
MGVVVSGCGCFELGAAAMNPGLMSAPAMRTASDLRTFIRESSVQDW